MSTLPTIPTDVEDPINCRILTVSEDRLIGFQRDPIAALAKQTELEPQLVIDRLRAMLEAGVIRRIRQTLLATSLALAVMK